MFDRLFGKAASKPQSPKEDTAFIGQRMARIASRDLFGPFATSPNGRYTLVWSDADPAGGRGGFRDSGEGRFALVQDGAVIVEGRMERPNDGVVVDSGVFLLNDWMFGQALIGRVCAFAPDGRPLLAHTVQANLFNNGLSPDGRFAVVQTANAPTDDGNHLLIFDLTRGALVGKFTAELGWADRYEFLDQEQIRLHQRDGGAFAYGFDGRFIDREAWLAHGLAAGKTMVLNALLADADGQVDANLARRWMPGLDRALASSEIHPADRGRFLRWKAESHEALGEMALALAAYEAAIAANPKIGVKRKIAQLRHELSS